jgi:hypothetical protein
MKLLKRLMSVDPVEFFGLLQNFTSDNFELSTYLAAGCTSRESSQVALSLSHLDSDVNFTV